MKGVTSYLILIFFSLLLGACQISKPDQPPQVLLHTTQLPDIQSVTLDDGRIITLPTPAIWTDSTSKAYRDWTNIRCVRDLTYRDKEGNIIVGSFLAAIKYDNSPEMYALLAQVKRYRPNGTLEAETMMDPDGKLVHTISYNTDGQTVALKVYYDETEKGSVKAIRLELPTSKGEFAIYRIDDNNIAQRE